MPGNIGGPALMKHLWRRVTRPLALGIAAGIGTMAAGALVPFVIGRVIDTIVADAAGLVWWCVGLVGLLAIGAIAGIVQERAAVATRLDASYRTMSWVNAHAASLGAELRRQAASGQVVNLGTGDIAPIGVALAALSRGAGGVIAVGIVAAVMTATAWPVGLIVLVGAALIIRVMPLVLKPYRAKQAVVRDEQGKLTTVAMDITSGLRVIKGLGAGSNFSDRYRVGSAAVRRAATRAATSEGLVGAARVALAGLLGAAVVFLGAQLTLRGQISVGELIAFFGYATFLRTPIRWVLETTEYWAKGRVSADRAAAFLSLSKQAGAPDHRPSASGLRAPAGKFSVVVASGGDVDWLALAESLGVSGDTLLVRHDDYLFSGTLRETADPHGRADEGTLSAAMAAASFSDVAQALDGGLDSPMRPGAAGLSGGEQQRLRLVRALVADPEVLMLIEPTSALDATTETQLIRRLREYRTGRTTVVFGNSPLLAHEADHVCWVVDGVVAAEGRHEELLRAVPDYRTLVARREVLA